MTKFLFTTLFVAFSVSVAFAQIPQNIIIEKGNGTSNASSIDLRSAPLMCNEAGTIRFANPTGQSNDFSTPTIFLCLGDMITVIHNGDENLEVDPDDSTPPGIAYAFYDELPTVTGPDLPSILADPSLNKTSPILLNGVSTPQTEGIWLAAGQSNGNIVFSNDGSVQAAFNNGMQRPTQFWFAPITVDNFADRAYENGGPCVDVNVDRAFSIVYLTEIQIPYINNNITPATGCDGEFSIVGGWPEFDANQFYDVSIQLRDDPSVTALINAVPGHNDTVSFSVPQPGIYDIIVEDEKSCGAIGMIDFTACRSVSFNLPLVNVNPGEMNVCFDLTTEGFQGISAAQFSLEWDPAVLQYTETRGFHPGVPGLGLNSINDFNAGSGAYSFLWPSSISFSDANVPDGESLFQICFNVIGNLGDESPIIFTDTPTEIQIGDNTPPPGGPHNLGFFLNNGQVNVSNDAIFLDLEPTNVVCFGENTGSILVKFGDGIEPYQIFYDSIPTFGPPIPGQRGPIMVPSGINQQEIPNLYRGAYEVIVRDNAGSEVRDTVNITEPPSIGVRPLIIDAQCFGDSIPEIRIEVREGTTRVNNPESKYKFTWDTPWGNNLVINSSVLNTVPEGSYSVTVSDANGCSAVAASAIFAPDLIEVPLPNINITDATCTGSLDGAVEITAIGGTSISGNYTYQWDGGFSEDLQTSVFTNLDPGLYFVTVTDDNNCSVVDSFEVSANKILTMRQEITNVSCFGDSTGVILAEVSINDTDLETLPYTFFWSDSEGNPLTNITSGVRSNTAFDLPAGTYFVAISDNDPAGCQVSDSIIISQPERLQTTLVNKVDETCIDGGGAMDASAIIAVTGGTFPYDYIWTNPMGDTVALDSVALMISADTLMARITDINGCLDSLEVIIRAPNPPFINSITTDVLDCFNDTDGSLRVDISPLGTPVSFIEWFDVTGNRVGVGETASNLGIGTYFVRVLGENQCASGDSALVTAPARLQIDSISVIAEPSCPGDDNGRLAVFASGGNQDYTYIWDRDGGTVTLPDPIFAGLTAGTYVVTVVDGKNCEQVVGSGTVTDPPSIDITFSNILPTSCFSGDCDGQATATAIYSDGTPGVFNFDWRPSSEITTGVDASTASLLCRGENLLTVSDGSCADTASVDIPSPPQIIPNANNSNITCNGFNDGIARLNPMGGVGNFMYQWSTGETTPTISGLAQGNYQVIITDGNGCDVSVNISIQEPPALFLNINQALTNDVSCNGEDDGVISLLPTGGRRPYFYNWSTGDTAETVMNLSPGTYFMTVTDGSGCTDSLSVPINEPSPLLAIIPQPEPPRCFGDPTNLVIDTVFGGNGSNLSDYIYKIGNTGISFPVDQPATVFDGVNIITVEDFNGCSFTDTIVVVQPELLEIIFNPAVVVVELGDSSVQLNPIITSTPGVPVESYFWEPTDFLSAADVPMPTVFPIDNQQYTLTVVDANGCEATNSVFVEVDANRNVYIPNVFSPNGDGENDIFSIFTCNGVSEVVSARIFDRWGELIHESTELTPNCDPGIGVEIWDGTFMGTELNPAAFVYVIEVSFIDGILLTYRGSIQLLR